MRKVSLGLKINADCGRGGEIRVGVQDAVTGQAIAGCSTDECVPITSDDVAVPIRWHGRSVIELMPESPVMLCFRLSGPARIYGFEWV